MTNNENMELAKKLITYNGKDKIVSCYEIAEALKANIENEWSIKSGIDSLDTLIDGFYGGEVTVISGVTGQGKTLISQTMTKHFFLTGNRVLWFSYEVRPKLFIKQFGEPLPEFYTTLELKTKDMGWLRERIYEAKLKYNIRAVFVDHLHYLLDLNTKHNISLTIGDIMRQIVNMAHEFDIHFFLLAHMSKTKFDKDPGLGDTRDSSLVEQEADNVFYIWRDIKNPYIGNLKIEKNRRNGVFSQKIALVKDGLFFREAFHEDMMLCR